MRIRQRNFILAITLGLIVLFGCGAPASTPSGASTSEPVVAVSTAPSSPNPTVEAEAQATQSLPPAPTEALPLAPTQFAPQPALPERRRLTLEFPPQIRAGDSDVVRLTLEVDDLGNVTPTAEIGGNVVTGKVIEIPNVYETHHVIAEARFDIAGMEVRPTELVSEPLTQGTSATFYWSVRPEQVGDYRGTIWLYLRFVDKSSGAESRQAVSAQIVEIQAVNLLGLSGAFARTTGLVGSIVGTVIGFPFLEDIVKFLLKRLGRRAA